MLLNETRDHRGLAFGSSDLRTPLNGKAPGLKYDVAGSVLLQSSAGQGEGGAVLAEIRRHGQLHCPAFIQPVTEIAIGIAGIGHYRRRADAAEQRFSTRPGFACICPDGVAVKYLHIDAAHLDLLHIYLPRDLFGLLPDGADSATAAGILYGGGIQDSVIQALGASVTEVMATDSSTLPRRLMLDSFGVALAARLLQRYARAGRVRDKLLLSKPAGSLDDIRLKRVTDYIQAKAYQDIDLGQLAEVACLSVFHFCRSFKIATGLTPFQYVAECRIARAKDCLSNGRESIDTIAFSTGFSSGSAFARAFRKAVGVSPLQFRAAS